MSRRTTPAVYAPAKCSGCTRKSDVRQLGKTPPDWSRDAGGQGRYWCPACTKKGRG